MLSKAQKRANKKYAQSKKGKIVDARGHKKYYQTEKGKAKDRRYAQSEKGKIASACGCKKYNRTEKGKTRNTRYNQTEKGKMTDARAKARRKRDLGYRSMNEWFPGCNGHHIDKVNVLFIPEKLHLSIKHSQNDLISMQKINNAAFEWLCTQDIL